MTPKLAHRASSVGGRWGRRFSMGMTGPRRGLVAAALPAPGRALDPWGCVKANPLARAVRPGVRLSGPSTLARIAGRDSSWGRNILKSMLYRRAEREPVDRVFHALAEPNRRVIVERLSRGPATVSELARPLPMSLSAVVQHLQVLQGSGLVRSEKVGRVRTCRIEPAALRPVEQWIGARRSSWERSLDRLGEYLAEGNDEPKEGRR
jgi:DNA-binding transcriptional ArsR family regulator